MRINNINLRTGWAEFKPPHPGDRQVRKCPREGMSFVIKPPILSRPPPPPTGFTLIGALLCSTTPLSTVQTRVQCNDNSTRSYKNQSVVFCTQNCIKACQNCFKHCLTVKLLKSIKVTLFNTCEKLKIDVTLGKVKGQ